MSPILANAVHSRRSPLTAFHNNIEHLEFRYVRPSSAQQARLRLTFNYKFRVRGIRFRLTSVGSKTRSSILLRVSLVHDPSPAFQPGPAPSHEGDINQLYTCWALGRRTSQHLGEQQAAPLPRRTRAGYILPAFSSTKTPASNGPPPTKFEREPTVYPGSRRIVVLERPRLRTALRCIKPAISLVAIHIPASPKLATAGSDVRRGRARELENYRVKLCRKNLGRHIPSEFSP
ncbi:hypothetical protein FB451DRAFT_1166789 [Mycena latifolia]|nr:hypothetical protein FB451DRAFT_1166789 [Mycena latifolia]